MDETIKRIQSILADSMQTLPLLLSGLLFFLGTLTANTGMLLMILSIVFGVKGLGFVLNLQPITRQSYFSIFRILFSLLSIFIFRYSVPYVKNDPGPTKDVVLGLSLAFYFLHAIYMLYIKEGGKEGSPAPGGDCSIFGKKIGGNEQPSEESEYNNPSLWLISVTYILGFIFANAVNVFNLPTPVVSDELFKNEPDAKVKERSKREQQKVVDDRVFNRKMQTIMIMLVTALVFIFVVWYRLKLTHCEEGFLPILFPLGFVILVSFSLYSFIVLECGIRPADVLGITYDMVHPDLVNSPIVCVTT